LIAIFLAVAWAARVASAQPAASGGTGALPAACLLHATIQKDLHDQGGDELDLPGLRRRFGMYQAHQTSCAHEAPYWWALGRIAMRLGRFDDASNALERAILIRPELAAARLDYALTLHALGDVASATELYQDLLDNADPPQVAAELIRSRLADLQGERDHVRGPAQRAVSAAHLPASQLFWRTAMSLFRVYESNPNNAPSLSEVRFTTIDGPIVLPLDPKDQPRPTGSWHYDLRVGADWLDASSQKFGFSLRTFGRAADDAPQSTRGYDASVEWVAPLPPLFDAVGIQLIGLAGWQSIDYGGIRLVETRKLGVGLDLALNGSHFRYTVFNDGACRVQSSLERDTPHYPLRQVLSGSATYIGLRMLCERNGWRWELAGRGGEDVAANERRPGGDQYKGDLAGSVMYKNHLGSKRLQLYANAQHDANGYNPLIENNKIRNIKRYGFLLEWTRPLKSTGWEWVISADRFRQLSSLSLFASQGYALRTGFRLTR